MVWLASMLSLVLICVTTTDTHTEYLAVFSVILLLILPIFNANEGLMNDD